MTFLLILCGFAAGLSEAARLRMRRRELVVFADALSILKSAVEYTAGDLRSLLRIAGENAFLERICTGDDPVRAWRDAAQAFFTNTSDRDFAENFAGGFGKTDLNGLLSYITLYEEKTARLLRQAEAAAESKCRLYTMLGLFSGTAAAMLLI